MANESLRDLEREVEAARARLTGDLAVLRSPEIYSEFADNLKQTALDTGNSLVDEARTRTQSVVDEVIDKMKSKAAANPAAVLLIGAGLAWHLVRRPPIVAALLGGGLYSLLRTEPSRSHLDDRQYMDEARARLKDPAAIAARTAGDAGSQALDMARHKAAELAQSAADAGRQATDMARQKAAELTEAATEAGRQAADRASRKAAELTETATQAVEDVRSKAAEWTGAPSDRSWQSSSPTLGASPLHAADPERLYPNGYYRGDVDREGNGSLPMDRILLGAAGVAVAAAVALAYQRRSAEHPSPDDLFRSG
jgi:hypothetical protein